MLLDIIIPIYNAEKYLPELFESLKAQTMQDYNLYLVDDCSTDKSIDIILEQKDYFQNRIHVFHSLHNSGPAIARNIALDNRKECSEFVMFIDADDSFENQYFEKMVNAAEKYNADMIICGLDRKDENGKVLCREMINNPEEIITDISKCDVLGYMVPVLWNKLFRNSCIGQQRFPDAARSEDTVFIFKILPDIKSIKFVNQVLYHYTIREKSMTGAYTEEMHHTMLNAFAVLKEVYDSDSKYEQYRELLELQMFIRCAVGGTYRLAFKNMKKIFWYEKKSREFLNTIFPDWRKNGYISFNKFYRKSLKQNLISICALLYKLHLFSLFIAAYWLMNKAIKKDIRF